MRGETFVFENQGHGHRKEKNFFMIIRRIYFWARKRNFLWQKIDRLWTRSFVLKSSLIKNSSHFFSQKIILKRFFLIEEKKIILEKYFQIKSSMISLPTLKINSKKRSKRTKNSEKYFEKNQSAKSLIFIFNKEYSQFFFEIIQVLWSNRKIIKFRHLCFQSN